MPRDTSVGSFSGQLCEGLCLPLQLVNAIRNLWRSAETSRVKPTESNKCRANDIQHEKTSGPIGQTDPFAVVEDQVFLPGRSEHVSRSRVVKIEHRHPSI